MVAFVKEEILRLDVAMCNLLGKEVVEEGYYLSGIKFNHFVCEAATIVILP